MYVCKVVFTLSTVYVYAVQVRYRCTAYMYHCVNTA